MAAKFIRSTWSVAKAALKIEDRPKGIIPNCERPALLCQTVVVVIYASCDVSPRMIENCANVFSRNSETCNSSSDSASKVMRSRRL